MVARLKELRSEKGISQQQLAGVLGISQQSVNKYENRNIEPDIATLIAIADYFDTTVDYVIGRTAERHAAANISDTAVTAEELRMIEKFRSLTAAEQACVMALFEVYKQQSLK